MIATFLVLLIIGIIIQAIPMDQNLKYICYLVIGIAVLISVLQLVGIDVGNLRHA